MMQKLKNRISQLVGVGKVKAVQDSPALQLLNVDLMAGEEREGLEHMLPYGFAHNPHPESEAVVVFPDGDRSYGLVIAVANRQYRLRGLETGEVALYDDQEQVIKLGRDGITLHSPIAIKIDAPDISISGKVNITGETIINGIKQVFD